jgi:hypothetical protein
MTKRFADMQHRYLNAVGLNAVGRDGGGGRMRRRDRRRRFAVGFDAYQVFYPNSRKSFDLLKIASTP